MHSSCCIMRQHRLHQGNSEGLNLFLFICNHRELISDKCATSKQKKIFSEYKWCHPITAAQPACYGKSINLRWNNNKAKMNLVNKFVINDSLLMRRRQGEYWLCSRRTYTHLRVMQAPERRIKQQMENDWGMAKMIMCSQFALVCMTQTPIFSGTSIIIIAMWF